MSGKNASRVNNIGIFRILPGFYPSLKVYLNIIMPNSTKSIKNPIYCHSSHDCCNQCVKNSRNYNILLHYFIF